MNPDLKRYELFGWDYELFNPLSDKEVAWYVKFAKQTEGPILELGCGTARLLISIAEANFEVYGIDLSPRMLEIAKKLISGLSPEIQSRIRIYNMDMSDFQLDQKFGLVIIADNSFGELKTKEKMLSCLRSVYRHLRSDGKLLVIVRRFDPAGFVNGRKTWHWSKPIRHPETDNLVKRKIEVELAENGKRIQGIMFYKIISGDGRETVEECPFEAVVMSTDDYISLFSEAGFSTNVFVDYEEKEDDRKNPILCFVCSKNE